MIKKFIGFVLVGLGFLAGFKVFADDVASKTDGSFVGDQTPVSASSSFMGEGSNSTVNDSFIGENTQRQTDQQFAGSNTIPAFQSNYFVGQTYDEQVGSSTDRPFAQDHSKQDKDGIFIGQNTETQTDGTFVGGNFGQ